MSYTGDLTNAQARKLSNQKYIPTDMDGPPKLLIASKPPGWHWESRIWPTIHWVSLPQANQPDWKTTTSALLVKWAMSYFILKTSGQIENVILAVVTDGCEYWMWQRERRTNNGIELDWKLRIPLSVPPIISCNAANHYSEHVSLIRKSWLLQYISVIFVTGHFDAADLLLYLSWSKLVVSPYS